MATTSVEKATFDVSQSRRTLLLIWKNPSTGRYTKIGQLARLDGQRYAFYYLDEAWEEPEFAPLLAFPDRNSVVVSDALPPFFANRVLSTKREGYQTYLEWLGIEDLGPDDVPCEVLVRTGAGRATDTFHVVEQPDADSDEFTSRFFVSGLRFSENIDSVLATLNEGDELELRLDESNEHNAKAVLIDARDGSRIGFVPDWLCGDIHDRIKADWVLRVAVERLNSDAPPSVRLLCRIEGIRST